MKRFSKNHVKVRNTYSNINNQNKMHKNQNQHLKLKTNDLPNNYLKNDNQNQGTNQETRNFEILSNNHKLSNDDLYNMIEISPSYKSSLTEYDGIFSSEGRYSHKNNINNKLFLQTPKNLFKKAESIVNKKIDYKNVTNVNALSDNKIIKITNNNRNNNNLTIIINENMNNNFKSVNYNITNKNIDKNKIINKEGNIKELGGESKVNLNENYNTTLNNIDNNIYNNFKFHNIIYSNINDNNKNNYSFNNKKSNNNTSKNLNNNNKISNNNINKNNCTNNYNKTDNNTNDNNNIKNNNYDINNDNNINDNNNNNNTDYNNTNYNNINDNDNDNDNDKNDDNYNNTNYNNINDNDKNDDNYNNTYYNNTNYNNDNNNDNYNNINDNNNYNNTNYNNANYNNTNYNNINYNNSNYNNTNDYNSTNNINNNTNNNTNNNNVNYNTKNNTNYNNNNEYYRNSFKNNINNENNINNNNFENNENNIDGYNNDLLNYNNYDDFNNFDNNYKNEFHSDNNIANYNINKNEYTNNEEYYNYNYNYDYDNDKNYNIDNNDYSNNIDYAEYSNNKINNNEYFNTYKFNNVNNNDNNYDNNRKESLQNDDNNYNDNNDFANENITNNYKYNNTDKGNKIAKNHQNNLNINNDYMNSTTKNKENKNLITNNFSYNSNNNNNKNEDNIKNDLNIITDFSHILGNNRNYNERNTNNAIKKYCQTNIKKSSFKEFKNILKRHRKNFMKDHNQISETYKSNKNSNKNSFIADANKVSDFSQSDKNNIDIKINNNLGKSLYLKRRHKREERAKIKSEKKIIEQYKENKSSNSKTRHYIYKSPELKTTLINDYSQNKSMSTNKRENKNFLNKFSSYNNINFLSVNVSTNKKEFQTPKNNDKYIPIRNRRKDIKSMPKMTEYNSFNYSDKSTFRIYNSSKTNAFISTSSKITDRYIDSYNCKTNVDTRKSYVKPGYKITKRNNDDIENTIKIVSFNQRKSTHNTHHSEIKITSSFSPNKSSFYNNTSDFNNNIKITSSFSPNQKNNTTLNNEIKNSIKLNETFSPNLKRKRPGNRLNSGLTIITCLSQSNKTENKYSNKISINKMITVKNNLNQNQIINNKTNNIIINHNIKLRNINKRTSEKQTEIDKFNKYINFGKSLLSKIAKKKCDKCNKLIDSHLFKIHYNSHPTEIFNWLYLGTFTNACDINELRRLKINYILNVANECNNKNLPRDIKEMKLNIKDSEKFEILIYFEEANEFINKCKSEGGILLVHCKLGISRSASFILAYLIKYHKLTLKSALEFVKQKRNQIKPNEGFMKQLYEYEKIIKV